MATLQLRQTKEVKTPGFEMKSILKLDKKMREPSTNQSSSVGAVKWTLPEEVLERHSSAPARTTNTHGHSKDSQQHLRSSSKDLRSLQDCVQFIQHWKEQVDRVCKKGGGDPEAGTSKKEDQSADRRTERSLEESRKLILQWANELHHVDKFLRESVIASQSCEQENEKAKDAEETQLMIMEWAKELKEASENCGVQTEELGQVLRMLGLKKKRLVNVLPLLELITWSLLAEHSTKRISQLWLLTKQRTWKAGTPSYIPNAVWSWICSAAADVTLDPKTNHPWLLLSDDLRRVQEDIKESDLPYNSQRFNGWPCVLGWEGYDTGRHYWEVEIANNGYWRIGLTTADSERRGRFSMTPQRGYWVLWRSTRYFYACSKPETVLSVDLVPRRMGIYLDYEEGQISFYNAETKFHIYTFTGTFRGKLYPVFAPLDGRTLMTIIPPHTVSGN
ncbi:nuclear factor 7, ovary [Thalassophryne amazonica]|uniref:nuclear factor 7, ovary n=1 Tax=Thalassophryne amazonica TaxID=390379 RepID=UPI00147112CB|nr:nuclear factor 7, ovary [Thalassophryne amazonica]